MGTYGERIQRAVAAQIRAEMAARSPRMHQTDLAAAAGISTSSLSRYLDDSDPRDIPLISLADIARVLGMSAAELVSRAHRRLEGEEVL